MPIAVMHGRQKMSKKRFIQAVIARSLPQAGKFTDAVSYAEHLWDELTRMGYGQERPGTPMESKQWLNELSDRQKQQFMAFWKAFSYKKDINNAAMRWAQLGVLSDEEAGSIIDAAKKEAALQLPAGQVRKMAQGWLFEKRWLDHKPLPVPKNDKKLRTIASLVGELEGVKRLYAASGNNALQAQIDALEQKLTTARNAT
jgi:hypothetical protein